jgi:hypothetical protein
MGEVRELELNSVLLMAEPDNSFRFRDSASGTGTSHHVEDSDWTE